MKPIFIKGRIPIYVYAKELEPEVKAQIERIKDLPFFRDKIVIMPDCHAGKGCVIGFTGYFDDVVIPNIVGVDIGCGVYTYPLKAKEDEVNLRKFDAFVKGKIPTGLTSRTKNNAKKLPLSKEDKELLSEIKSILINTYKIDLQEPILQVATLGSGNHFLELGKDENGRLYLTVHTGSRNLGLRVCNHFQRKAAEYTRKAMPQIPKDLSFLPLNKGGREYLRAMKLAQKYADLNRRTILKIIVEEFFREEFDESKIIKSVHNYIDLERDMCVRKGAISAHKDERVVIPFNLTTGLIIGRGKGIRELNFSAPHGAGRKVSRRKAKEMFSVSDFQKAVEEAGVYSTTVNKDTLDEAPFAYKDPDEILEFLPKTVEIETFVKPIYNLKG
ncbi:tRNA-splicing ligase RtcB [Desulfurobacterium pacificum]|uniref:3'-phosphate/5'-hydroxy nucleic acid ligase n=1 Tax=Desulfurobacterium pacificum TaxID=240166 RepID=A0ABY1NB99_9BACT|nr:RtcB family protein [Desulfurobacterium pacificum]SMP04991.1 tRNA-splicing ligase RtcB [Desulfurobacterium pacificum]